MIYPPQGQGAESGGITTQSVVTSERAFGVEYQNNTGKPMWVAITTKVSKISNQAAAHRFYSDNVEVGAQNVPLITGYSIGDYYLVATTTFIVLPGKTYEATTSVASDTIENWTEWY